MGIPSTSSNMRRSTLLFIFSIFITVDAAGKRGLCIGDPFNYTKDFAPFKTTPAVSWYYNWSPNPKTVMADSQIQFVPMQWNGKDIDSFESNVLSQCASHILAFNEPDLEEQANMTPENACNLWNRYIVPLKNKYGIKIGLPVISAGGGEWLSEFMRYCPPSNNSGDFLPLHWYGIGEGGMYDYLWSMHYKYPTYNIWLTEFASESKSENEMVSFSNNTIKYLDSLPWIERYAFFGTFRNNSAWPVATLKSNGSLSKVGYIYVNQISNNTAVNISSLGFCNNGSNPDDLKGRGSGDYISPTFFILLFITATLVLS